MIFIEILVVVSIIVFVYSNITLEYPEQTIATDNSGNRIFKLIWSSFYQLGRFILIMLGILFATALVIQWL